MNTRMRIDEIVDDWLLEDNPKPISEFIDDILDELMKPNQAVRLASIVAFAKKIEELQGDDPEDKPGNEFSRGFAVGQRSHSSTELDAAWQAGLTAIREGK